MREGAVAAVPVVEALDVVEDHRPGLAAGCGQLAVEAFGLEGRPEGLHRRVVVAVAAAAHARADTETGELGGEVAAGVLAALVAMVDQAAEPSGARGDGMVQGGR